MNLSSGHKRVNSAYTQPYSGQKLNPRNTIASVPIQKKSGSRENIIKPLQNVSISSASKNGKGSILFQNVPLKFEGDLLGASKRPSREPSRSPTPNKSLNSARGFGSITFKPNLSFNNGNIKTKKMDISGGISLRDKTPLKNTKKLLPSQNKDLLNLSNISGNRIRLNDSNNSFLGSDPFNRSNINSRGSSANRLLNLTARSSTPNSKVSNLKITKSNGDLHRNVSSKSPLSRSPMSKFTNKVQSVGKVQSTTLLVGNNFGSGKNAFDSALLKQLNNFKNNKSPTPNVLKNFNNMPKKVSTPKIGGITTKKVVTGNLMSMNMTNDASTNSTFVSKEAQSGLNNNGTNNSNNLSTPGTLSKDNTRANLHINPNNPTPNTSNNTIPINSLVKKDSKEEKKLTTDRINLQKEKELKGSVDFREITTSPLLRKKQEVFKEPEEEKDENLLGNIIMNGFKNSKNYNLPMTYTAKNPVESIQVNKVIKKTIKLIHEFSKVGFNGYGVKKVNQDNYFVFKNFVGNSNHYFMAVCDGHGSLGHEVSGYLRENLPLNLNNVLKNKNKNVNCHNINSIIEDVFLDINYKLHSNEIVDTTFSGSTCVSLIYTQEKIITANVGDSRAVLGRFKNDAWVSHDLTRDHKPDQKDESARIKKRGGRIEPFKDDDGGFVGPSRVWLKEDDIPGLAMSRSFGDRVASSVGVVADPEIIEYKFQEEDKFFIIASDGVWEFIESDECVKIVKDFYLKNDIVGCCEYLHKESSARWMREEEVIDDISMIIVFLE